MTTIKLIGQGIRDGSKYLPIRHLAGRAASLAPAKDYPAQIQSIFDAITRDWWRYTFDPVGAEVLTVQPERIFDMTLGSGKNNHSGYGDCDDIATASGALLNSIGFQTIIGTSVRPGSPNIFDHVFIFVKAPGMQNWLCFDPVLYPKKGLGDIVAFNRLALWSLDGKLLKKIGPFPPRFDAVMKSFGNCQPKISRSTLTGTGENETMENANYHNFVDYSDTVQGFGEVPIDSGGRPQFNQLPDFQVYGIAGFGMYNDEMGYMTGDQVPNIMAEVDNTDMVGNTGLVRTKHFELDPDDYAYMVKNGVPRVGAMALGDDGDIVVWQPGYDGMGGFFKRLARRVKKRVKKVAGKIGRTVKRRVKGRLQRIRTVGRGIKRFAKRIGKTKVFRLGKRVLKTAMKYVKPILKKYGGKIMRAVAPVAAMIPGAGPFISTALVVGGRAYDIARKAKVIFDKFGKPIFKSIKQAKDFKGLLKNAARQLGKRGAKNIMKAYAQKKGLAGFGETDMNTWGQGMNWRTVDHVGFGWV
jgi:hypothetical protein